MSVLGVMHLSSVWACCFWYTRLECQLQKILQGDFRHSPGSPRIRAQHTAGHAASLSLCGLLALLAKSSGVPDWFHVTRAAAAGLRLGLLWSPESLMRAFPTLQGTLCHLQTERAIQC